MTIWPLELKFSPEKVHFGLQICDIRKFCFALRQMTEMPQVAATVKECRQK